jgi:hypothetical protein
VDHFIRRASVRALSSANHWVRDWSCQHLIARRGEFVFDGATGNDGDHARGCRTAVPDIQNMADILVEEFETLKQAASILKEAS